MENQTPVLAKKLMSMARALLIILHKGKSKLLLDLNVALKRGKVVGRSFVRELVFSHHSRHRSKAAFGTVEGEMVAAHERDVYDLNDAVGACSPALPGFGFGRSPAVRQLRVTDSPFPISGGGGDSRVDEKAEEFIRRFYSLLQRETSTDG